MEYIPYQGQNEADVWLYLDELEKLDLDLNAHTDIFDVLEEISRDSGGLRRLVERYASSHSAYVFGYVAAAISHFARVQTSAAAPDQAALDEITELTFKMLRDVRWLTARPDTLAGLLNTIGMLIWSQGWNKSLVPETFAEILERCLKFGWAKEGQANLIRYQAVQIVVYLAQAGMLTGQFSQAQIIWFQREVESYQSGLAADDSLKSFTFNFAEPEGEGDAQP